MKEIIEFHEKLRARGIDSAAEDQSINFSREVIEDTGGLLPEDLHEEMTALQTRINAFLPDDADYFVFVGRSDEAPVLDLLVDGVPLSQGEAGRFRQDESIFSQLESMDWEALRQQAAEEGASMRAYARMMETPSRPPRATKHVQRDFREEAKKYIREKRTDLAHLHLLWWNEETGLREEAFVSGDELKNFLPKALFSAGEVVTIVVNGKPLPVERIDALLAEAHKKTGALLEETLASIKEEKAATEENAAASESLPSSTEGKVDVLPPTT